MKVNSAIEHFIHQRQGVRPAGQSSRRYDAVPPVLSGGADIIEISDQARARFKSGRAVTEKDDGAGQGGTILSLHELAGLGRGDESHPARRERVFALKEQVASGVYDFEDPGKIRVASEAILAALLK